MLNSIDCEEFLRWMKEAFEREKARKVFIFSDQLRNAIAKSGSKFRYGSTFSYSVSSSFFDI